MWRDGAKDKRPETNVLKELLPYLEKEHAITRDPNQRTIMGIFYGSSRFDLLGCQVPRRLLCGSGSRRGGGTSFTDPKARNYVPEYGKKTKAIQETLKLRLVQGGLNTRKFRDSLDQLKISYDYFELPKDIAAYLSDSCCLNKKDPTRKFLHNPICMTENAWGLATWAFIEKNTLR